MRGLGIAMEIVAAMTGSLVAALAGSGTPWWVSTLLALAALLLYSPLIRDWAQQRRDHPEDGGIPDAEALPVCTPCSPPQIGSEPLHPDECRAERTSAPGTADSVPLSAAHPGVAQPM